MLTNVRKHVPDLKPLKKNKLFAKRDEDLPNLDIEALPTDRSVSAHLEAM